MNNLNINNIDFSSRFLFTYFLSDDDSLSDVSSLFISLCDFIPCSDFVISNIIFDSSNNRVCHILLSFSFPIDLNFFVSNFPSFYCEKISSSYYDYIYNLIYKYGVFIDSYD